MKPIKGKRLNRRAFLRDATAAVQFTGVDQAHKQIAYAGAVLSLIEIRIFPMENCFL